MQIVSVLIVNAAMGPAQTCTVMVTCAEAVQPAAEVPVTVYVVVAAGKTFTGDPFIFPGFQTYVDAPVPVSVVCCPTQMVVELADAVTVGEGFTVMTCVLLLLPFPLVAVSVTVYVPAAAQVTPVTFCVAADPGVPEGNVQDQEVGPPVELSVKFTACPMQIFVALAVNAATGAEAEAEVKVRSSIATEGSVPTPSSLFVQRKPIFTAGLLFAETGKAVAGKAVQRPCPPQPALFVGVNTASCDQVEPS